MKHIFLSLFSFCSIVSLSASEADLAIVRLNRMQAHASDYNWLSENMSAAENLNAGAKKDAAAVFYGKSKKYLSIGVASAWASLLWWRLACSDLERGELCVSDAMGLGTGMFDCREMYLRPNFKDGIAITSGFALAYASINNAFLMRTQAKMLENSRT